MGQLSFVLINGLIIGSIYALSACGVSFVAGLMRVVNFAHGEFYVLGAYLVTVLGQRAGMPPLASIGLTLVALFFIGLLLEKSLLKSKYGDSMSALITTFVLSIVFQNLFLVVFGPYPQRPAEIFHGSVHLFGDVYFGSQRIFAGTLSFLLFLMLYFYIRHSRFGRNVRAVAQDRQMAEAFGIDSEKINSRGFALGACLAGTAGILLAPTFPVVPGTGSQISLTAFVVIVLGGLGSLRGCLIGGLLLGLVENLGAAFFSSAYAQVFGFLLLIGTLLFKPSGIYGNKI